MMKINKINKHFGKIIVLSIMILMILFGNHGNHTIKKIEKDPNFYPYEYLKNSDESNLNKIFKERYIKISREESIIRIGRNQKEVDNEYWDIKISYQKDRIAIDLNKLVKEEKSNEYISNVYFEELVLFFQLLLNVKEIPLEQMDQIKNTYINLRKNYHIEVEEGCQKIEINSYQIIFQIQDNKLHLEIEN